MTKLSVNVNKVATLRNTRPLNVPSVLHCAKIALDAGAHGITIHPRPDHRHIRPDDVAELATLLKNYPEGRGAEFNIEGNPFFDYMPHIRNMGEGRPTQCTLVPDSSEQATSDHGWELTEEVCGRLGPLVAEMKQLGCRVSLFMDADVSAEQFEIVKRLGADRVELYTEPYARAFEEGGSVLEASLERYAAAAACAGRLGLGVNAGHDLNLGNLPVFLGRVAGVAEVSIGHALIADALEFGMAGAVGRYLAACGFGSPKGDR